MFLKRFNIGIRLLMIVFLFIVVPLVIAYVLSIPFINANYIINTFELLMGLFLLLPGVVAFALSQWWTTLLWVYYEGSVDYYYLLMGWSMKEAAIIDTLPLMVGFYVIVLIIVICFAVCLLR